ncbi:hypothetical protein B1207_14390 [Legionella quinlivanii]|uniref:YcaO domain-containing protein n=1 Tax=Legionella quinlivanii TaxID=45073 RepID=A0A364LFN4_9GAMM|nr:YcaO-like family protein [Legionella quinlivanii]RAP34879.1 hypothetical protein B1207_14390 [Legionella quinlivanii]
MARIKPSLETVKYLLENLDKFGISRISDLTYLDSSFKLFVYSAIRPSAKSLTSSMGKGITIEDAKCSALMESVETFYAEEVLPDVSNTSLKNIISSNNYFIRPDQISSLVSISEEFPIDWCWGTLLNLQKEVLIPHCFLSLDSNNVMNRLVGQNSNGLASGNSFEEALIYSFWELNERISVKNNKKSEVLVDKKFSFCIDDNIECIFYLYESPFCIPVVGCQIRNKSPLDIGKIFAGYASHSNIYFAMERALFEAIQSKVGVISGVRDDITDELYVRASKKTKLKESPRIERMRLNYALYEISVSEEYKNIKNILSQYKKDLAYYCYTQSEITVLKSFLVDI